MIFVHFDLSDDVDIRDISVMPADAELKRMFFDLLRKYKPSRCDMLECLSVFYSILSVLERQSTPMSELPRCATVAKRIFDEQYYDVSISVSSVADAVGVSDSYLRRTFNRVFGVSPGEYLVQTRIRNAKNLLELELFSITQIAELCGFNSVGYFIQCFRQITGYSPGRYRKRMS
jgi:AraC-like DNA-binding protein